MNVPWVSLVTTLILCVVINGKDVIGLTNYGVKQEIADVECLEEHIVFTSHGDVTKILCVIRCFDDLGCKGVFFSATKKECMGCSRNYGNSFGLPSETGTQYFVEKHHNTEFKRNQYELKEKMTFYDGVNMCESRGGHMLQIDSGEENEFIASLFGDVLVMWLGLTDERTEGEWEWYNYTSQTGYINWWENFFSPVPRPDENCAVIMQKRDFRWSDRDCSKKNTLICEFER